MSENTEARVARLAAELAEAQAQLERENQRKAQVRDEALARVTRELLSSVVDHHVRYVFETSHLSDLPLEALLEDYEEGEMNLVVSRLCDRKGVRQSRVPSRRGKPLLPLLRDCRADSPGPAQ